MTDRSPDNDPDLAQRAQAILAALPSDPDAIATLFESHNIKGARRAADRCPVARWLMDRDGFSMVGVTPLSCHLYGEGGRQAAVPVPSHVGDFMMRFDQGLYPQLDVWRVWREPGKPVDL